MKSRLNFSSIKYLFFILLIAISNAISAQIEILPSVLNFGVTSPETNWVVDVHIKNTGDKKDFLLRTTFSHEYEVLYTSKTIQPDSTIVMRVKFVPRVKEKYDEKIELYFASMSEPIILPVKATVEFLNPDDHIPCPDFSRLAAECCSDNLFMIQVEDEATGKPIPNAEVLIVESEKVRMKLKTNPDGKVAGNIPIAYYEIRANNAAYESASTFGYINHRNANIKLKLKRWPDAPIIKEEPIKEEEVNPTADTLSLINENLLTADFLPNNLVYLLDVSSSMAQGEKLDLMKGALKELIQVLRPEDKITLVSYASNAKVLLTTTTGDQKSVMNVIVSELHADGSTSGAKGFKTSYDLLRSAYIKNGNNQLVVITDGVFQPADQLAINKLVKRSRKKKITTSIVGIQCASFAVPKLSEVSSIGGGSFLPIENRSELNLLIEELKRRSAK